MIVYILIHTLCWPPMFVVMISISGFILLLKDILIGFINVNFVMVWWWDSKYGLMILD